MLQNQALLVALMMMVASPAVISSDEGQSALDSLGLNPSEDLVYEPGLEDRESMFDDSVADDSEIAEDCYTPDEWKKRLSEREWGEKDWEQDGDKYREDSGDGARGGDDRKEQKEDYNKDTDKVADNVVDKDCFTEAEFDAYVSSIGSDRKDTDCLTVGDVKQKWAHFHDYDYDKDMQRESDRAEDRESDEDERDADDEDESDEEEDDEWREQDEHDNLEVLFGELKEACDNGDEEACLELRELIAELEMDRERDWDREQKDEDDSKCVGKHMMNHMKKIFSHDRAEDKEQDWGWVKDDRYREDRDDDEEWAELRAFMAELGVACDEGDEEACEELEELIAEIEKDEHEHEEECDRHDDDDEQSEEEDEEGWDEEEEDDSENDEPEEA